MPLVPESVPVGLVVEMDLPELGLTDLAWVTDIADCPEIESRDSGRSAGGSVVTATLHHSSGDVIDLTLGSKPSTLAPPETIGTTSNHPLWSVDRQEYVQAGQLDVGERVLTFSGDTKRVVTKLPRPGPQPVYNLEVHAEHVYFVGGDGILVHNAGRIYTLHQMGGRFGAYKKKGGKLTWKQYLARNKHRTWPPKRGADGETVDVTLPKGTMVDRFGTGKGRFASPVGTSIPERALSPGTTTKYPVATKYELVRPLTVKRSKIAPWFGESEGGIQYEFPQKFDELVPNSVREL